MRSSKYDKIESELEELRLAVTEIAKTMADFANAMKMKNVSVNKPKGKRAESSRSSAKPDEPLYSFYG
jgi:hypothetical protein